MPPRLTSCTECQDYSPPGPSARGCHLLRPLVIIGATGLQSPLYGVEKTLRIRQVMCRAWHTADPCLHRHHGHYCFFITTARATPTCHFWTLIPLHVPDWEGLIKLSQPLIPEESPTLPVQCNYKAMHCSTNQYGPVPAAYEAQQPSKRQNPPAKQVCVLDSFKRLNNQTC